MIATRIIAGGFIAVLLSVAALARQAPQSSPPQPVPQQPPPAQTAPPAATQQQPPLLPVPARPYDTVVIDPGHGGPDAGARGSTGILEKDFTLFVAVLLRDELQRQGVRAVITRQQNENPSFDERAALANAFARPIFVTLHAASTGQPGTARAYHSRPLPAQPVAEDAPPRPLPAWDEAQNRYLDDSRRLAQFVQAQLAEKFEGSPKNPAPGALRQLKSITGPAIAVEVSSVAARERKTLDQMADGVAAAIARGIAQFRGGSQSGEQQ